MPPKKIDPKLVTKSITSFGFNKITKAEAELRLLEENLQAQKLKVNREHEQRKINDTANRATLMASLVDSTTVMQLPNETDDNNCGNRVGDAFQEVIEQIGNHVELEQFQITKVKKVYKKRPAEWKEIVDHFQQWKNIDKTINAYKLLQLNPNVATWSTNLSRWTKELKAGKESNAVRGPVIGSFLVITTYSAICCQRSCIH